MEFNLSVELLEHAVVQVGLFLAQPDEEDGPDMESYSIGPLRGFTSFSTAGTFGLGLIDHLCFAKQARGNCAQCRRIRWYARMCRDGRVTESGRMRSRRVLSCPGLNFRNTQCRFLRGRCVKECYARTTPTLIAVGIVVGLIIKSVDPNSVPTTSHARPRRGEECSGGGYKLSSCCGAEIST